MLRCLVFIELIWFVLPNAGGVGVVAAEFFDSVLSVGVDTSLFLSRLMLVGLRMSE